jgi:hypothetical protein
MKDLKDLPSFGVDDFLAPIIYLLYRKGIIDEQELIAYINDYNPNDSYHDILKRIESLF